MTALRIKTAVVGYGLLAAIAVAWGYYANHPNLFVHPEPLKHFPLMTGILMGAAVGISLGLSAAWLTRFSVYRFQWAKHLHTEFRGLLGPMTGMEILAYAALSSIGEELFFRGAMQPVIGIVPTALIFGFSHVAWGRKSIPWPFQAIVMGFVFGGLYWLTGNLTAPILAHFLINYQNLHFINRYDPSLQLPRSFTRKHDKTPLDS